MSDLDANTVEVIFIEYNVQTSKFILNTTLALRSVMN